MILIDVLDLRSIFSLAIRIDMKYMYQTYYHLGQNINKTKCHSTKRRNQNICEKS